MEQKFSEFREFDNELRSVKRFCPSHMSYWHCDSILVSNTKGCRLTEFGEFRENSVLEMDIR